MRRGREKRAVPADGFFDLPDFTHLCKSSIAAVLASEQDMLLIAEASNGREALEQFRTHQPDVTLINVQMPEVNGIDLRAALDGRPPREFELDH